MRRFASLLACLLLPLAAAADPEKADPQTLLLSRMIGPTPLLSDTRALVDGIGGRPTGSAALDQAIAWGLARFKEAGLENVHPEPYRAPSIWLSHAESAELVSPRAAWESPEAGRLRVAGMPFTTPTPPGGLEAPVADVGAGDEAGFASAGPARVRGAWVLIHTEPMRSLDDLFKEYLATPAIVERARVGGAAGVLWISNRPARLLYRHNATLDGSVYPLPGAVVEREGGLRLSRLIAAGQSVRVKLTLDSEARKDAPAQNVVAELRGREKPDEVIILGAHLDSWDLGRGALDNASNVALVLDVARQMAALAREGFRPRRTVRFALYTGEEAGLWGSWAEARSSRAGLDRVKAQIVYDVGTGRTTGFSLGGREDLRAATEAALRPVAAFGPFTHTADAFVGTDNYDYLVEGVPTLVANQEGGPYLPDYHAESDTFDKVDARELKVNAAIAAALAFGLADAEAAPAPRQSREQVEALLKATGLDTQMKVFGIWEPFQKGERGREAPARKGQKRP